MLIKLATKLVGVVLDSEEVLDRPNPIDLLAYKTEESKQEAHYSVLEEFPGMIPKPFQHLAIARVI